MDHRSLCVSAAVVALFFAGPAQAANFTMGFANCPGDMKGAANQVIPIEIIPTLTSADNPGADGAQGWSISVAVAGAVVKSVTVKGVTVPTFFDDDGDLLDPDTGLPNPNATPLVDAPLDLIGAGFILGPTGAQKATGDYTNSPIPGTRGIVSAVVLHQTQKRVLHPTGTVQLCKINIEATVPPAPAVNEVVIRFLDALKGVGQPVNNVVTFGGSSQTPAKGECKFTLKEDVVQEEFNLAMLPQDKPIKPALEGGNGVYEDNLMVGERSIACLARLTTKNIQGADGPQGWSLSIAQEACLTVESVSVKGVTVNTFFDDDGDLLDPDTGLPNPNATPLIDAPLDLIGAGFILGPTGGQKATGDYTNSPIPGTRGVVSAVVLHQTQKRVLKPNASDPLLRVVYRMNVVKGVNPDCKITFLDALKGVGQPVNNVVTQGGTSKSPTERQGLIFRITGVEEPVIRKNQFTRGDANNDGKVNIADVVWIVYSKVLNDPAYPTACRDAGDANDDEAMNVADAVYVINWQFRGGPKPTNPGGASQTECGTDDDSTDVSCPEGSTRCPVVAPAP